MNENSSKENQSGISLRDLIELVIQNKILIGISIIVFGFLGYVYLKVTTPVFKVDALVQVEEKKGGSGGALAELNSMFSTASPAETEIEIIKSRMVLGEVVNNLNLHINVSPKYFPIIGRAVSRRRPELKPPLFGMSQYFWGGEKIRVDILEIPKSLRPEKFILKKVSETSFVVGHEDGLIKNLKGEIGTLQTFNIGKETFRIFINQFVANIGAEVIISQRSLNSSIKSIKSRLSVGEKGKKTGMIGLNLEHTNPDFGAKILNEIVDIYVRQNVSRKSEDAAKTLFFLKEQLPILKRNLEETEDKLNKYRLKVGSVDLSQEASITLEQSIKIENELILLSQKKQDLRRLYQASHPEIKAIDSKIGRLESQRQKLAKNVKSLPKTQQEILRLSRDVQVNNELYTTMLNNAQQLQVVKAGEIGNVRIVDYALPIYSAIKPKKIILVFFLFLGFVLPILALFLKEVLYTGIDDVEQFESLTDVQVMNIIPFSPKQKQLYKEMKNDQAGIHILSHIHPDDIAVESFRSLRTTLHFKLLEASNNILMISGPSPSIGKSFVSVNLANVFAQSETKVLLIDGDIRKGYLQDYFELKREHGLSDFLKGDKPIEDYIKTTPLDNLDFISTGTIPDNPSELLMKTKFAEMLEHVSKQYEFVFIDAPPILAVTDAAVMGKNVGTNLILFNQGKHSEKEIKNSIGQFRKSGVNVSGTIVNNTTSKSVKTGSKYYGYGAYSYTNK